MVRRLLLVTLVAVCATFVACDNVSGGKAVQPPVTARASASSVLMIPRWVTRDEIGNFCAKGQLECTSRYLADGQWVAVITAVEPRDFNDFNAIETLGHGCWHGFGARHDAR